MDKFFHLLVLCGLLIPLSWALTNITITPIHPTTEPSRHNTTGNLTGNISNSSPNSSVQITTGTTTPSNNHSESSTTPNSTTSSMQNSSTVPSPTVQTEITTLQTNSSTSGTTPTSLATQPASKPATAVSTTLTFRSSAITVHGNESTSGTGAINSTTETTPGNKTNSETTGAGLKLSEMSMTILFSVILGVLVLLVLGQIVYKVSRNKHRSVQYSHRPLYNDDTGEQFVVPDDTLVISGGLYDGPQIYNPTVTTLNDEDQPTFAYMPTQLRLEFLHEEQGTDQDHEATSFETFKTTDTSLK